MAMLNALDFIDNPLSCMENNDPILVLNVAEIVEDGQIKLKLIDHFIDNLSNEKEPYLTGYALYMKSMHFDGNEKNIILKQAIDFFIKSILSEKDTIYAQTYLTYAYYDLEDYGSALKSIKKIPKNYFSKKHQKWRDILIRQLEICCLIRLNRLDNLEEIIYDYFVLLTKAKELDVVKPIEFVETIKYLIGSRKM